VVKAGMELFLLEKGFREKDTEAVKGIIGLRRHLIISKLFRGKN